MRLRVLAVTDCPNVALLDQRLDQVLADRGDVHVEHLVVDDSDTAAEWGMAGSPTLLVDGVDPFAAPGQQPSVSCRLYRNHDGHLDGAPSTARLRAVLATGTTSCGDGDQELPGGLRDVLGGPGASRRAPAGGGLAAVQQAVLRGFAATGHAPDRPALAEAAGAGIDVEAVLDALHEADFLRLDHRRHIVAAYPFSGAPTRHQISLPSGIGVHAMCAIDALGIGPMLGVDTVISSTDPSTGQPITVTRHTGITTWQPDTAVVLAALPAGPGPAAEVCCGQINFFTDHDSAHQWADTHPTLDSHILDAAQAEREGRTIFGLLLAAIPSPDRLTTPTPGQDR